MFDIYHQIYLSCFLVGFITYTCTDKESGDRATFETILYDSNTHSLLIYYLLIYTVPSL